MEMNIAWWMDTAGDVLDVVLYWWNRSVSMDTPVMVEVRKDAGQQ